MNGNNISLKRKNVIRLFVDISDENGGNVHFNFKGNAILKVPKEEGDLSFLVSSSLEGEAQGTDGDVGKIKLETDYFFESEKLLAGDEYEKAVSNNCMEIIQKDMHHTISDILKAIGVTEVPAKN